MLKIASILFLFFAFISPCPGEEQADGPHMVHNIWKGGFSVDGYDVLIDNPNFGPPASWYIAKIEVERITTRSFRYVLHLSHYSSGYHSERYNTRVINHEDFAIIKNVEKLDSGSYQVTLDDGTHYKLKHCSDPSLTVQPQDLLALQPRELFYLMGKPYYVIERVPTSGNFKYTAIFEDGSKCYLSDADDLISARKGSAMKSDDGLFFGGAVLKHYETSEKTWAYPNCCFPLGVVTRDHTRLPGYFQVDGPFRKPNALIAPNTFRIRYADYLDKDPSKASTEGNNVIEFYDFYPGSKFSVTPARHFETVRCLETLTCAFKVDDQNFFFTILDGQRILLTRR